MKLPSNIVQLFLKESRFRVTENNVFNFLKLYKEKHVNDNQDEYNINELIPSLRFNTFNNEFVVKTVKILFNFCRKCMFPFRCLTDFNFADYPEWNVNITTIN